MNNVLGTQILLNRSIEAKVRKLVLISTDKAVRPASIMGASKRLSEFVLQKAVENAGATSLAIVRFGNVIGSSGSVVPIFREQIAAGGPVTVTHPDATRYFMTVSEAAQLVIQAGAMAETVSNGEKDVPIFFLEMGNPIRIYDLAIMMIRLAGLSAVTTENPDGDIEVKITGLKQGEKIYEELWEGYVLKDTENDKISLAKDPVPQDSTVGLILETIQAAHNTHDVSELRTHLENLFGH